MAEENGERSEGVLRERNRVRVLDALRRQGTASRSQLARLTGLSRTTVGSVVADLQSWGLVVEHADGDRQPGRGRPPVFLSLDRSAGVAVGIDFDHDRVRVALADADRILGNVLTGLGEFSAAAEVYHEGLDLLASPPDFAESGIAQSNRAELLAGRGRLEQAQASAKPPSSPAAMRYRQAACADYRNANAVFQKWAANRGMFLTTRRAMADVETELPGCSDPRGLGLNPVSF